MRRLVRWLLTIVAAGGTFALALLVPRDVAPSNGQWQVWPILRPILQSAEPRPFVQPPKRVVKHEPIPLAPEIPVPKTLFANPLDAPGFRPALPEPKHPEGPKVY